MSVPPCPEEVRVAIPAPRLGLFAHWMTVHGYAWGWGTRHPTYSIRTVFRVPEVLEYVESLQGRILDQETPCLATD